MKRLFGLLLLMCLLSACLTVQADERDTPQNAPEDAIFEWAMAQPGSVANTLAIRQVAPLDDSHAPVLVSFQPEGWPFSQPALGLFEVEAQGARWVSTRHDYAPEPDLLKDTFSFHNHAPRAETLWAAAYGLVVDERVTHVALVWSDGLEQSVDVKNGSYLSIRTDDAAVRVTQATALDSQGSALAVTQNSQAKE